VTSPLFGFALVASTCDEKLCHLYISLCQSSRGTREVVVGLKSTRRDTCSVRGGFLALHGLQGQLSGDLGGCVWDYEGVRVIRLGLRRVAGWVSSRPVLWILYLP
jgi:hypothetical protein